MLAHKFGEYKLIGKKFDIKSIIGADTIGSCLQYWMDCKKKNARYPIPNLDNESYFLKHTFQALLIVQVLLTNQQYLHQM